MDDAPLISAFVRSDQCLCAQLAEPEALPCGTAYCSQQYSVLSDANQLCDVSLTDLAPADAFDRVETHFASRHAHCLQWTLSPNQPHDPIALHFGALGWTPSERLIFGNHQLPADQLLSLNTQSHSTDLRILPARAMRRAHSATFSDPRGTHDIPDHANQCADAASQRLDDANYDAFVATLAGRPAGRAALMLAGDIGRVHDLFVLPDARGRGVARALLRHLFQLAYRLRPRVVVADAPSGDSPDALAARHLLAEFGLRSFAAIQHWRRPVS